MTDKDKQMQPDKMQDNMRMMQGMMGEDTKGGKMNDGMKGM